MNTFFTVLIDALIVGVILIVLAIVFWLAWSADSWVERARCFLAILLGVIVIAGSRAFHMSYPAFLAKSLTQAKPGGGAVVFFATVVPGGIGVGLGWYVNHLYKSNPRRAIRITALVGTLAAGAMAGLYVNVNATNSQGFQALPNVAFVAGLIIFMVFGDDEKPGLSWYRRLSDARVSKR